MVTCHTPSRAWSLHSTPSGRGCPLPYRVYVEVQKEAEAFHNPSPLPPLPRPLQRLYTQPCLALSSPVSSSALSPYPRLPIWILEAPSPLVLLEEASLSSAPVNLVSRPLPCLSTDGSLSPLLPLHSRKLPCFDFFSGKLTQPDTFSALQNLSPTGCKHRQMWRVPRYQH